MKEKDLYIGQNVWTIPMHGGMPLIPMPSNINHIYLGGYVSLHQSNLTYHKSELYFSEKEAIKAFIEIAHSKQNILKILSDSLNERLSELDKSKQQPNTEAAA